MLIVILLKKYKLQIIRNLGLKKAHVHAMISIRILQLCGASIFQRLEIIFKTCLRNGRLPLESKKGNAVPFHKKDDKQTIKKCCLVLLLPIYGKIFERLLYDTLFIFL